MPCPCHGKVRTAADVFGGAVNDLFQACVFGDFLSTEVLHASGSFQAPGRFTVWSSCRLVENFLLDDSQPSLDRWGPSSSPASSARRKLLAPRTYSPGASLLQPQHQTWLCVVRQWVRIMPGSRSSSLWTRTRRRLVAAQLAPPTCERP